ncbi:MAG TPA: sugar-binding protein [Thiolinea sp.]|nr:sugar-binding protein [Thiolinea sp.]
MINRIKGGRRQFASIILALSALVCADASAYFNSSSPMGTNTNEVLEYDSSVPFIDLFKASLPFREAAPYLTKGRVDYDRYGWPTYIAPGGEAGTRLISKLHENAIPRGYYVVLYDGDGKLEYGLDAKLVQGQKGRDVIMLDPGKDKEYNAKVVIKSSNPQNPLRNIRVLPSGGICAGNPFERVNSAGQCKGDYLDFEHNYAKIIFNPDYLTFMRDYKVIRFMNMGGVTRNPIRDWADRSLVDDATWGGAEGIRGAPLEIMVELANRLHADAWFNIPHAASNDYITHFARYVKNNLNPGLKVYVEYSNETWNGIFSQHAYMKQGGKKLGLTSDAPHIAGWKFYAKRSVEIFDIFEQVFGSRDRLIRVLAGLTGSTEMTETMLGYENAYQHTDAFAVAPYVFGDYDALRKARSVNQVFQIMQDRRYYHSLPRVLEAVRKQSALASKFGVDLIAYEGGQHLIDDKTKRDDQHPNDLFYAANRHPNMGVIYKRLFEGWKQAGGKMFVHFSSPRTYNRFGSKGTKEYITQPDKEAPKHLAIESFIKSNPCWWNGCSSPVTTRTQKPAVRTTTELSVINGDVPRPQPNTPDEKTDNMVANIPQLSAPATTPAPSTRATGPGNNVITNIPQLEPLAPQVSSWSRPILVALSNPPQEKYVFGNKAVSLRARDPRDPFSQASGYQLRTVASGRIDGSRDLAAFWQSSWDSNNFYLRVAVGDDRLVRDSEFNWQDDSIEIFIDADASMGQQYDNYNDYHLLYRWRDRSLRLGKNSAMLAIAHQAEHIQGYYVLTLSIPWNSLHARPRIGHRIGIDVHVNDDDDGGDREGKLVWRDRTDNAYRNPSVLGEVVLAE